MEQTLEQALEPRPVSLKIKALFAAVVFLTAGVFFYTSMVFYRSWNLYRFLKTSDYGIKGGVMQSDGAFGFTPRPGAGGDILVPQAPPIPMAFDKDGFRTPVGRMVAPRVTPVVMTFGCSFTFGDACAFEDTYSEKLARRLGGSALNAGVPGAGLAEMLVRAQRLIPLHKPDIVVVQYSGWLVARSQSHYSVVAHPTPVPYFAQADSGRPQVYGPGYVSPLFDLPMTDYRGTPAGAADFLSFAYRVGIRLFPKEDFGWFLFRWRLFRNTLPYPGENVDAIAGAAFAEIQRICRENGARMVIVALGGDARPVRVPSTVKELGVPVVDAQAALLARLPEPTTESYYRRYAHHRGDPPRLVDTHPNPRAHTLIADALFRALKR